MGFAMFIYIYLHTFMESNFLSRITKNMGVMTTEILFLSKKMFQQKYKYFNVVFNLLMFYTYLV